MPPAVRSVEILSGRDMFRAFDPLRFYSRQRKHFLIQRYFHSHRRNPPLLMEDVKLCCRRSFSHPTLVPRGELGNGIEYWMGYYQSLRATQMGLKVSHGVLNIRVTEDFFWNINRLLWNSTMATLPIDLITDILSRLPVKTLLRFKCVSKPCGSLIDISEFAELLHQSFKANTSS